MTIHAQEASEQPLTTSHDKIARVRDILAPARSPAQLWVLLLDRDSFQSPLMVPIDQRSDLPDPEMIEAVISAVSTLAHEQLGNGCQAMFVLERTGPFGITEKDHCWAAALDGACARTGIASAGTFLLSPGGVSSVVP